jgi:prophage antirepressor-like protein
MNNQIIPFNFENHDVRVVLINGVEWWVGQDVAVSLRYKNPRDAMYRYCKGVVKHDTLQTGGGKQQVRIINEGDVFRLITHSKLPEAQRFEKWLFEEVLPQIRKTGSYSSTPNDLEQRVRLLEQEANIRCIAEITDQRYTRQILRENRRYRERFIMTNDDRHEILTLLCRDYPISKIAEITKKSRNQIKKLRDYVFSLDDAQLDAVLREWCGEDAGDHKYDKKRSNP